MPNIVDRFGQLVDDAIPKPELARQLLLLGYRAKDVQLLLAPEKELTPARQYAAQIAMDAMIAPLAHPQRAALVNIFMPCELLHAFHLLPMFAEATACYLNGAAAERGFIHYAESAGISPTLCSYHKALLGMGLSGTAGKPLFTACTSIACDANNLTFRRLAQHYGIPHFYLDVPYDHDEYAVAEVSDRLREFAAFLEDATHQKLDEAALQQAVAHSGRTLELLQQAQAAKAGRNLHNDVTSEFYEVFVTHTMLGTPQAEQYARKLLADIEASPMGGGTRLLWAHAVPFYQAPVRERLNFSAENQLITCDMNADTLGCCMDPDKPFESMAARLVNNIFNGSAQHRIQRALELCRMQQIDGVVSTSANGAASRRWGPHSCSRAHWKPRATRCCCWTAMAVTAPTRWTARPPPGWMLSWRCCTANRRRWYEQNDLLCLQIRPAGAVCRVWGHLLGSGSAGGKFFLRGALRPRQPVRLRQGCAGTGGTIRHPGFGADQLLRCHAARLRCAGCQW